MGSGDTKCTTPHITMIPECNLDTQQMNSTITTEGAYIGSEMYTTNLETTKNYIINDFTSSHILSVRRIFDNAITNGYPSSGSWYDSDIDLMSEPMVYGEYIISPATAYDGSSVLKPRRYSVSNSQLAIFRYRHDCIGSTDLSGSREGYWLLNVCDSARFAFVSSSFYSNCGNATGSFGVRPAFLIY